MSPSALTSPPAAFYPSSSTHTAPRGGRCLIVFEGPGDLLHCMEDIASDPDVAIERVNDRLSPTYDARLTAGYRSRPPSPRPAQPRPASPSSQNLPPLGPKSPRLCGGTLRWRGMAPQHRRGSAQKGGWEVGGEEGGGSAKLAGAGAASSAEGGRLGPARLRRLTPAPVVSWPDWGPVRA